MLAYKVSFQTEQDCVKVEIVASIIPNYYRPMACIYFPISNHLMAHLTFVALKIIIFSWA